MEVGVNILGPGVEAGGQKWLVEGGAAWKEGVEGKMQQAEVEEGKTQWAEEVGMMQQVEEVEMMLLVEEVVGSPGGPLRSPRLAVEAAGAGEGPQRQVEQGTGTRAGAVWAAV